MAKTAQQKPLLRAFEHPLRVEVRAAEFEPLALLSYVDVAKLGKGTHTVEIGFADGGCCRSTVSAIVKNGMVTGLKVEPCKESKNAISKEARRLVDEAYKRIGRTARQKWTSVPVSEFFASPAAARKIVITWVGWCIQVCWTSGTDGVMTCVRCCLIPPRCSISTISTGPL
jgi:hypothetical protein